MTSPTSTTYQPIPTGTDLWMGHIENQTKDTMVDVERQQLAAASSNIATYPPASSATADTTIETCHPKGLTTWTYNPIWPMRGTKQRALGPIASSRQIALEITRRAFPTLCHVPDHKINFEVAPGPDMALSGPCITILDDAWEAMVTSPARAMLVSVRESPDEADRRIAHESKEWYTSTAKIVGGVVGGFFVFICLIAWLSSD